MAFVLDASATVPWCFVDEVTDFTEALLSRAMAGEELHVPAHWPTEVVSALLQAKRRNRITDAEVDRFLTNLSAFRLIVDAGVALEKIVELKELAVRHNMTAYDAAYLDLAIRRELPIATLDGRLRDAAMACGCLLSG